MDLANVISFKALVDISHLSGVASQEVLAVTKQGERHDNYAEQQYQLMKRGESSSNKRQINLPPYSYTGRTAVADNGSTVLLPHYPVFISHGKARDMLGFGAKSYDVKEASSTDETIIEVTRRGGVFGFRTGNDFYHPHKNCQTDYCNTRISSCGGTMWELANLYGHLMVLWKRPVRLFSVPILALPSPRRALVSALTPVRRLNLVGSSVSAISKRFTGITAMITSLGSAFVNLKTHLRASTAVSSMSQLRITLVVRITCIMASTTTKRCSRVSSRPMISPKTPFSEQARPSRPLPRPPRHQEAPRRTTASSSRRSARATPPGRTTTSAGRSTPRISWG